MFRIEKNTEHITFPLGTLILGDARELIKGLPDGSIDLILTDPPYGLGFGKYDNAEIFYSLEDELYRVLKPDGGLVFYWSIKNLGEPFKRLKRFRYVWQIIGLLSGSYTKSRLGSRLYFVVLVFEKEKLRVRRKDTDLIYGKEIPVVEDRIKNQLFKPTGATSQLITMFSNKSDLILDPFAGFGSILLCCKIWGRRFLGFEIDQRCYEKAKEILISESVGKIGDILNEGKDKDKRKNNKLLPIFEWMDRK